MIIKNDEYDDFLPCNVALNRNTFSLINEIKDSDQLKNLYICNVNYPEGKFIKFYYYELPEKNMMINKNVKELIAHNVDETIVTSVIADLIAWHILKEDYEIKFHYNFANLAPELATRIIADAKMMYESLK